MLFKKEELKTYGSGFSGIGGFEGGIEKVLPKSECLFYSEIEPFAIKSYELLYPHHVGKGLGDVTKISEKDLPSIDFLVGGFPCQAFSIAGKQLGFQDTRGTLFFELARIAKEKQPKLLLLENVKNLISHNNYETLQVILKVLNDIGYHVTYNLLNTAYYNLPHNRERIFILAVRKDLVEQSQWYFSKKKTILEQSKLLSFKNGITTFDFEWPKENELVHLKSIEDKDNTHYFTDDRTKRMLNGNVDFWNELKSTLQEGETVFIKFNKEKIIKYASISNCLTARDYKGPSKQEMTGVAKMENGEIKLRQLNEVESYRLQGFTDEQIKILKDNKMSRTQMIKQAGNAVSINTIEAIFNSLIL